MSGYRGFGKSTTNLSASFDNISGSLDDINLNTDSVEFLLNTLITSSFSITSSLNNIETKVCDITGTLNTVNSSLSDIDSSTLGLSASFGAVSGSIINTDNQTAGISASLGIATGSLININSLATSIESKVCDITSSLLTVISQLSVDSPVTTIDKMFRQKAASGSTVNMVVDGSSTNQIFTVDADPTDTIVIQELKIVVTTDDILANYASFIESSELTNGCLLEIQSNGVSASLANFKLTEDFFDLPTDNGSPFLDFEGQQDILSVSYPLPNIKLFSGSSDFVKMTIRDELNSNPKPHIEYGFILTVIGYKE